MSSIGVDTGGTFTDLVLMRDDGTLEVAKRPSTPPDFARGVFDVVEAVDGGSALSESTISTTARPSPRTR